MNNINEVVHDKNIKMIYPKKKKKSKNIPIYDELPHMPVSNFFSEENDNDFDTNEDLPWIEKYRPMTLSAVSSHEHIIAALKEFIENKSVPHLLFYGPPGTGKTSTIISCVKDLYKQYYPYMVLEFNASDERGVDVVREKIKTFVWSKNFFCKGFKFVILDEADAMTGDAQKILRQVIEKYSSNARFCLICNYVSKIIHALQSRCIKFRFKPLSNKQIKEKLVEVVVGEEIKATVGGIGSVVKLCKGDMRKALNILQSTYMTFGYVNTKNVYKSTNTFEQKDMDKIINWLNTLGFQDCYGKIENIKYNKGLSLKNLLENIKDYLIKEDIPTRRKMFLYDRLAKIEFQETVTSNDTLQLGALVGIFILSREI